MVQDHRPNNTPGNIRLNQAEHAICASVGQVLEKHYPGWKWHVICVIQTGTCTVKNLNLHGDYGIVLHLGDLLHDPDLKCVMRGAGELLERCGFPRGQRPVDNTVERDVKGNVKNIDTDGA